MQRCFETLTSPTFFRDYKGPLELILIRFWLDAHSWTGAPAPHTVTAKVPPPDPAAVHEMCIQECHGRKLLGNAILLTWGNGLLRAWTSVPFSYSHGHADGGDQTVLFQAHRYQDVLLTRLREEFSITEFEEIEGIRMFVVTLKK